MDCLSAQDPTQIVTVMKGAQLGLTEAAANWIGYVIDCAPGPMLAVQPTVELAKRFSKQRIDSLIESTPRIAQKVLPSRSRDSGNTMMSKEFPGGLLILAGANSAAGLRSMPARNILEDEIDAYPADIGEEGDPIGLAEARARTFARRKIFRISTPKIKGRSKIEKSFEQSDQRFYEVPCPHCGAYQALLWDRVRWPKDRPLEAVYLCAECEKPIEERFKTQMLAEGRWVAKNPDRIDKKHVGFFINSLYSPLGWMSWGEAAQAWIDAQGDQERLKVFINTILGEPWEERGDAPEWERLYERRENYPVGQVPAEAIFLTAAADVQKDRLELEVVAWGCDKQSWSVCYRVYPGDTSKDECWDEMFKILDEHFECEDGSRMPVRMLAVDTGYNTQEVYNRVRKYPRNRVLAVKGRDNLHVVLGLPSAVDVGTHGRKLSRGIRVWPVGTSVVKSELYGWLRLSVPTEEGAQHPAGFCHFPQYDAEYFKMLTAEEVRIRRTKGGGLRYQWEKRHARNEALDCRVYNRAAASLVGLDRLSQDQLKAMRYRPVAQVAAAPTAAESSSGAKQPTRRRRDEESFW